MVQSSTTVYRPSDVGGSLFNDLKRFEECDADANELAILNESTCPVKIIEKLPEPPNLKIDIRIVSFKEK